MTTTSETKSHFEPLLSKTDARRVRENNKRVRRLSQTKIK